jgi:uncharacterized protein
MSQLTQIFDLGTLRLHSGEGRQVELQVPIDGFAMGGQDYTVTSGRVVALLDVSHTTNGYALRLRFDTKVDGPCMRCLDNAGRRFDVDSYEVDQPGGGEDLTSPYLKGGDLNVADWARDALLLALPTQILCSDDCKGLCVVCGENLNTAGPDHVHEAETNPVWAKLDEIKFE